MGKRQRFATNHQRSWLWGRNVVLETIRAGLWPIEELYWATDLADTIQQTLREAQSRWLCAGGICDRSRLTQLGGNGQHQGVLARMGAFPCGDMATLMDNVSSALSRISTDDTKIGQDAKNSWPLWVVCDRIQDAFNLGAILRVCDGVRTEGVIIGSESQAPISPQVARSSAGAVNFVPIFQVSDLATSLDQMSSLGVTIAGASEKSSLTYWQQPLRRALAIIIGNEGEGIEQSLQQRCHVQLSIPMTGKVSSLNAAVAAGVLLYEIRRQQWTKLTTMGRPL